MGEIIMTDVTDKMVEALAKLVILTRRGTIQWTSVNPASVKSRQPSEIISHAFVSNYSDKKLRLYRREYREYEETEPSLAKRLFTAQIKISNALHHDKAADHGWKSEVVLEVIDEHNNALWEFPKTRILEDLMSTVKYKASDIDDLIDKLSHELA